MNVGMLFLKHSSSRFWGLIRTVYAKICLRSNKNRVAYLRGQGAKIGSGCNIGSISILGSEPYLVEIGNNVYFSGTTVSLFTHDGGTMQLYHMGITDKMYDNFGKIKIGDNCFIGAKSTILKNVTIGNNCIIGAGSVVTKSVPDNSIVAGVPAKVIGTVTEYYEKNKAFYVDTVNWHPYKKYLHITENAEKYEKRRQDFDIVR